MPAIHQFQFEASTLASAWTPVAATERVKIASITLANNAGGTLTTTITNGAGTTIMSVTQATNTTFTFSPCVPVDTTGLSFSAAGAAITASITLCRNL